MLILQLTTPALLFSALSLLLLAYTNRFLTLATLVRSLHRSKENGKTKNISLQIKNLRARIILIRNMQFLGIASLFFCVLCMLLLFLEKENFGKIIFAISLILMMLSLATSMREIQISVRALNLHLSDCEENC